MGYVLPHKPLELESFDEPTQPKPSCTRRRMTLNCDICNPPAVLPEVKATNPKDAVGTAKVPWSTIPAPVLGELGLAMLEGARKYGRHNYRAAGVRASVYYDAVVARHLAGWWEGEDLDPDSGLSHITKALAGLVVLRDSMMQGNWVDDRPPPSKPGWLAGQNAKAAAIIAKYPDAKPAFTALDADQQQQKDQLT